MSKLHSVWFVAVMGVVSWPALARDGQTPSVEGTIASVDAQRLVVKTTEGKSMDFVIDARTVCARGEAALAKCDARAGERVVVEFEGSGVTKTATRLKLPVRPVDSAAQYVCPMHPEVVSDSPGRCLKCGMTLERKRTGS
jgi:hypothetical protein